MKVAALILTMFLAAVSAAGQFVSNNIDIPESQYLAAEKKAEQLLKTSNYRSDFKRDLIVSMSVPPVVPQEHIAIEQIGTTAFRFVREAFGRENIRFEYIKIGDKVYSKRNDESWTNNLPHGTTLSRWEDEVRTKFKYLGIVSYEGQEAEFYSMISESTNRVVSEKEERDVRTVKTTRIWYLRDGRLLRKTVDKDYLGEDVTVREVTTYEYDPKGLKIEAPIK